MKKGVPILDSFEKSDGRKGVKGRQNEKERTRKRVSGVTVDCLEREVHSQSARVVESRLCGGDSDPRNQLKKPSLLGYRRSRRSRLQKDAKQGKSWLGGTSLIQLQGEGWCNLSWMAICFREEFGNPVNREQSCMHDH